MNVSRKTLGCVVGFGEILWDLLPNGKQLGGAPANFVYHAMALGGDSHIVSAVGNDILGREILYQLDIMGLNKNYIVIDDSHPTGTVLVHLDSGGSPSYIIHEKVAWDFIPFLKNFKELASRTQAVCFGTLIQRSLFSRSSLNDFLECVPTNCFRIFDVNLRQNYFGGDLVLDSIRKANIIKLNLEELSVIADICSLRGVETEIMDQIISEFNLELGILTKADQGSWLITEKERSFLKTPAVDVVDTVGAGDSFAAAVAIGLLEELPLRIIHQRAVSLAAFVCTQKGATPKIPNHILGKIRGQA